MVQNAAAMIMFAIVSIGVVFLIALVILIFFCATLQKALSRCSPRNRTMEPGLVWLNLIPFFSILFWSIYTSIHVGNSLKNEFEDRDIDDGGDYGKSLGIWTVAVSLAFTVVSYGIKFRAVPVVIRLGMPPQEEMNIGPLFQAPLLIAFLVMFVTYWVRIAGYSRKLADDRGRRRDEDDDDEPRRSTRPSRPDDRIR
jgi:hypothetical protein